MNQYQRLCNTPSDINLHLPVLKKYAEQCKRVTEFGVRTVVSTYAFIEAKPKVIRSYDINKHQNMHDAIGAARENKIDLKFYIADVLDIEIEETDFLFIDTLHTKEQLERELKLHSAKAKKFIGFHDVATFGYVNEVINPAGRNLPRVRKSEGLMPVIIKFLFDNPDWHIDYFTRENNGLMILKKAE